MTKEQRKFEIALSRMKMRKKELELEVGRLRESLHKIANLGSDDVPENISVHLRYVYLLSLAQSEAEFSLTDRARELYLHDNRLLQAERQILKEER